MTWQSMETAHRDGRAIWCKLDFKDGLGAEQHAMHWDKRSDEDAYPWVFHWSDRQHNERVTEAVVVGWRELPE